MGNLFFLMKTMHFNKIPQEKFSLIVNIFNNKYHKKVCPSYLVKSKISAIFEEAKLQKKMPVETYEPSGNQTIMSKVLIGHYATFDEAQKMQNQIKAKNPTLQPFVRKVGGVFSVQMGSYQDFSVAKTQAQFLSSKGLDVWIYQQ